MKTITVEVFKTGKKTAVVHLDGEIVKRLSAGQSYEMLIHDPVVTIGRSVEKK